MRSLQRDYGVDFEREHEKLQELGQLSEEISLEMAQFSDIRAMQEKLRILSQEYQRDFERQPETEKTRATEYEYLPENDQDRFVIARAINKLQSLTKQKQHEQRRSHSHEYEH